MQESLKLTPRILRKGCGIYEAGDTEVCYVKLFVTDTGYVLPVNHRIISEEDLMDVYVRGFEDGRLLTVQFTEGAASRDRTEAEE